jgi:hypothetical protein
VNPETTYDRCMKYVKSLEEVEERETDPAVSFWAKGYEEYLKNKDNDDNEVRKRAEEMYAILRRQRSNHRKMKKKSKKEKKASRLRIEANVQRDGLITEGESTVTTHMQEVDVEQARPNSPTVEHSNMNRRHTIHPDANLNHHTWSQSVLRQCNNFWQEIGSGLRDVVHGGADGLMELRRKGGEIRRRFTFMHDKHELPTTIETKVHQDPPLDSVVRQRRLSDDVMLGRRSHEQALNEAKPMMRVFSENMEHSTCADRRERHISFPIDIPDAKPMADGLQHHPICQGYDDDEDLGSGPLSPRTTFAVFGDLQHSSLPDSSVSASHKAYKQRPSDRMSNNHALGRSFSCGSLGDSSDAQSCSSSLSDATHSSTSSSNAASSASASEAMSKVDSDASSTHQLQHAISLAEHADKSPQETSRGVVDVVQSTPPTAPVCDMKQPAEPIDTAEPEAESKRRRSQHKLRNITRKVSDVLRFKRHNREHTPDQPIHGHTPPFSSEEHISGEDPYSEHEPVDGPGMDDAQATNITRSLSTSPPYRLHADSPESKGQPSTSHPSSRPIQSARTHDPDRSSWLSRAGVGISIGTRHTNEHGQEKRRERRRQRDRGYTLPNQQTTTISTTSGDQFWGVDV